MEEIKKHEESIIESWESIRTIVKDGKIDITEIPSLLVSCLSMFKFVSKLLFIFKVDPKVNIAINSVMTILDTLINNIDANKEQLEAIWLQINKIFEDKKVSEDELKSLLILIAGIFGIITKLSLPFIKEEDGSKFMNVINKIKQYIAIVKIQES
jgi:hypothetical protein